MRGAFFDSLEQQLKAGLPFAAYRYPGETLIYSLCQDDSTLHPAGDYSESGFYMAPFRTDQMGIRLNPDRFGRENFSGGGWNEYREGDPPELKPSEKSNYLEQVERTVQCIRKAAFEKVVLSRKIRVASRARPLALYRCMLDLHPDAFCYIWYHPRCGLWMGAAPETLFAVEGGDFNTMSLAGTRKTGMNSMGSWGNKEVEEQAIVTRFLLEQLKEITDSLKIHPTRTVQAGNLLHLQTRIEGHFSGGDLRPFLNALHPSPAVCGFPKTEAMAYILKNEGYEREFYTGYLGPLDLARQNTTASPPSGHFFVNIRCMQWKDTHVEIYAGGGITIHSVAEEEYREILAKAGTMLKVVLNAPL